MLNVMLAILVLVICVPSVVILLGIVYLLVSDSIEQKRYWEEKRNNNKQNS